MQPLIDAAPIDESTVETESVSCSLCGSNDFEDVLRSSDIKQRCAREYTVVRCASCGLAFLNPRPTRRSMARYYVENEPEKVGRKPFLYEKLYFGIFRKIPRDRAGLLLDVGCGAGRYIYTQREKGWDVKGIDIGYTEYGRKVLGLDIREGEITDGQFEPESFDAITFWWTLEHMFDPAAALREAHRLLKKGGVLIAGVPDISSPEARIFKRYWFHLFLPKHLYHFTPASLSALLGRCGFTDVRIRHDLFSFGMLGSLQLILNARGIRISLRNPFFYAVSLPLDIVLGLLGQGGLMTAYAVKR